MRASRMYVHVGSRELFYVHSPLTSSSDARDIKQLSISKPMELE